MTIRGSAAQTSDAQIAGIDEADKLGAFVIQQGVGTDGIGRRMPDLRVPRLHVCFELCRRITVAAMTVGAAQLNG